MSTKVPKLAISALFQLVQMPEQNPTYGMSLRIFHHPKPLAEQVKCLYLYAKHCHFLIYTEHLYFMVK